MNTRLFSAIIAGGMAMTGGVVAVTVVTTVAGCDASDGMATGIHIDMGLFVHGDLATDGIDAGVLPPYSDMAGIDQAVPPPDMAQAIDFGLSTPDAK